MFEQCLFICRASSSLRHTFPLTCLLNVSTSRRINFFTQKNFGKPAAVLMQ